MKEFVITLKEPEEYQRVSTCKLIKDALKEFKENDLIDFVTREKYNYTPDEKDKLCTITITLDKDCTKYFEGAFRVWFAYNTGMFSELKDNPGTFVSRGIYFECQLSTLTTLSAFCHRTKGMGDDYKGKLYVKLEFSDSVNTKDKNIEVEPLEKHAKYFNKFTEFNCWDF